MGYSIDSIIHKMLFMNKLLKYSLAHAGICLIALTISQLGRWIKILPIYPLKTLLHVFIKHIWNKSQESNFNFPVTKSTWSTFPMMPSTVNDPAATYNKDDNHHPSVLVLIFSKHVISSPFKDDVQHDPGSRKPSGAQRKPTTIHRLLADLRRE